MSLSTVINKLVRPEWPKWLETRTCRALADWRSSDAAAHGNRQHCWNSLTISRQVRVSGVKRTQERSDKEREIGVTQSFHFRGGRLINYNRITTREKFIFVYFLRRSYSPITRIHRPRSVDIEMFKSHAHAVVTPRYKRRTNKTSLALH